MTILTQVTSDIGHISLRDAGIEGINSVILTVLLCKNFCLGINLVILLIKYFVWKCKLQKTFLNQLRLLMYLKGTVLIFFFFFFGGGGN